jgi:hypothetical protein
MEVASAHADPRAVELLGRDVELGHIDAADRRRLLRPLRLDEREGHE